MFVKAGSVAVKIYKWVISPMRADCCKFYPSCSSYALEALEEHGVRGFWLILKRIARCQPLSSKSGIDLVERRTERMG